IPMNELTPERAQHGKPMRSTVNRWRRLAAGAAIVTIGLVPAAQASAGTVQAGDQGAVTTAQRTDDRPDHGHRWSRTSVGLVASTSESGVELVKPDGSRTTVPVDESTTVTRTAVGSLDDVTVGAHVSVLG